MVTPLIGPIGPGQVVLLLAIVLLVFGASRLPELARGTGRALRIFKTETAGLLDDTRSDIRSDTASDTHGDETRREDGPGR